MKKKNEGIYMDDVDAIARFCKMVGMVKKKWHTVDFYLYVNDDGSFYIDEFRLSSCKRRKRK